MKISLIIGLLLLLTGLFMVLSRRFIARKVSGKSSVDEVNVITISIGGYWLLFSSFILIAFNFLNFKPGKIIWFGLVDGVIMALLTFISFFFSKSKGYEGQSSGKDLQGLGEGALVLFLIICSPFIGLFLGLIMYLMIH
jgi:hypothetical protein